MKSIRVGFSTLMMILICSVIFGLTPQEEKLFTSIENNDLKAVKEHISPAININSTTTSYRNTPLHIACESDSDKGYEIVKYLIEKGADIKKANSYRYTPLHVAVKNRNLKTVKLLVEKGADINAEDTRKETPLALAVEYNYTNIEKYLLSKNAKMNTTRLILSCQNFCVMVSLDNVKQIIKNGEDINAKDTKGATALHYAALTLNLPVVRYLIQKGARVNERDKKRRTPLNYAYGDEYCLPAYRTDKGYDYIKDTVEFLKSKGAFRSLFRTENSIR